MKRKLFLRSIGCLALVLCAVLGFGTASSSAISLPMDLTGVEVGAGGAKYNATFGPTINGTFNVFTEYTFQANELASELPGEDWGWAAFCVQSQWAKLLPTDGSYRLVPIPGDFDMVALKMADRFFFNNTNGYQQRDYQIAIWDRLGVVTSDLPLTETRAAELLGFEGWDGYNVQGQYALAISDDYQNFLVRVPEPGTILLLGAGLIGLVGFRRFRKK